MNENTKKILDSALKRSKELDREWKFQSEKEKIVLFQTFVGIIILELEMNEFISDLDLASIAEIRKMPMDECWNYDGNFKKIPDVSDDFLKEQINKRVKAGYHKIIDTDTGEMKVLLNQYSQDSSRVK